MTTRTISLSDLRADPSNARKHNDGEVDGLISSMREVGLLQPIVVREGIDDPETYLVVAGARRWAAAEKLGWRDIEAVVIPSGEDTAATIASAAENIQRRAMHPVDQWRALAAAAADGLSIDDAAAAIGIDGRLARRMQKMGNLIPEMLDLMLIQMPGEGTIRNIANASPEMQRAALKGVEKTRDQVAWGVIAQRCEVTRIARPVALNEDVVKAVAWEEDLFAQPDDETRFTTADIGKFLNAQAGALNAECAASKGRLEIATFKGTHEDYIPKGWRRSFDPIPKRWKKADPRKVIAWVVGEGWRVGQVERVLVQPAKAPKADSTLPLGTSERRKPERAPVTATVQVALADLRTSAIQTRLPAFTAKAKPADLLAALLLALTCNNVGLNSQYGHPFADIAGGIIDADGKPHWTMDGLRVGVAEAISRIVQCPTITLAQGSGPAADWLGTLIGADLPRCDTADILAGFTGEKLREIASAHRINTGGASVAELRRRMAGNMPGWKPVSFLRPGPGVAGNPMDDEEDA